MCQCLDDDGELVIELRDLAQCGWIIGVLGHGEHFRLQGIFDRHADVVDGWGRGGLVGGVDTDSVREFDGFQEKEVWNYSVRDLWKIDRVCPEYLKGSTGVVKKNQQTYCSQSLVTAYGPFLFVLL